MLKLKEILKANNTIRFDKDFCDAVGILKQNLRKVENSEHHFTPKHIENAGKAFAIDMNFIFGFTDKPFTAKKKLTKITSTETSTLNQETDSQSN